MNYDPDNYLWDVWCVPVNGETLHKEERLHSALTYDMAQEAQYMDWTDDPAPDKADFYKLELREYK